MYVMILFCLIQSFFSSLVFLYTAFISNALTVWYFTNKFCFVFTPGGGITTDLLTLCEYGILSIMSLLLTLVFVLLIFLFALFNLLFHSFDCRRIEFRYKTFWNKISWFFNWFRNTIFQFWLAADFNIKIFAWWVKSIVLIFHSSWNVYYDKGQ